MHGTYSANYGRKSRLVIYITVDLKKQFILVFEWSHLIAYNRILVSIFWETTVGSGFDSRLVSCLSYLRGKYFQNVLFSFKKSVLTMCYRVCCSINWLPIQEPNHDQWTCSSMTIVDMML
jgi:hypothetical protein